MNNEKLPTLLLKTSSIYFAAASILHAYLSYRRLFPFFSTRGSAFEAIVFKNISIQLSGYFVINSQPPLPYLSDPC